MASTYSHKIKERRLKTGEVVYDIHYRGDESSKTKTFYSLEDALNFSKELNEKKLSKVKKNFSYPDVFFGILFENISFTRSNDRYVYEHFDENYMALRTGKVSNYISEKEFFVLDTTLKEGHTLDYTGQILGVTRERVRAIQSRALMKLRRYINVFEIGYNNFILENDIEYLENKLKERKEELIYQIKNLSITKEDEEEFDPSVRIPIESIELNFSTRTINALRRVGIKNLSDISKHTEIQILKIRNLGAKSIKEIKRELEKNNLKFKKEY